MTATIFALPGNEVLAASLAHHLQIKVGQVVFHSFPDGENYVQILDEVRGKEILLVSSLGHPGEKFLPFYFLTSTLKDLGAGRITLITPYLPYMRQDQRFKPGEGITSRYFARLVSQIVDALITVDPHLHRFHSLGEIYSIPTQVVSAAPEIARWIHEKIERPLLIGPDEESEQWLSAIAAQAQAPYEILKKNRRGDEDVSVSHIKTERSEDRTPVIIDDIISSAHTMIETVKELRSAGYPPPICIGVHAIFANDSYQELKEAGASSIVTCNTIAHPSNQIDLSESLSQCVFEMGKDGS